MNSGQLDSRASGTAYVHQQWNGTPCPRCLRPLRCVGGHLDYSAKAGKTRAYATYSCETGHRYQAERHDSAAGSRMSDLWEVDETTESEVTVHAV